MTAENPFVSPSIAGYNASPPPDDGSKTSANQTEWSKHIEKIGDPVKTLSESAVSNTNDAFSALIVTTDPGQETIVVMTAMYGY